MHVSCVPPSGVLGSGGYTGAGQGEKQGLSGSFEQGRKRKQGPAVVCESKTGNGGKDFLFSAFEGGGAKNRWVPRDTAVQPDRALMDCNFRAGEYDHNGFYAPPSSKPYGGIDKQTANLPTLKVI